MNARQIVKALGGRWHGSYGMARCPVHADRTPSLKVADGENGDVVVHCFGGCNWRNVKGALRRDDLLPDWGPEPPARPDPEAQARHKAEREAEERVRIESVRDLWRAARPVARDDPAGRYLTSRDLHGLWPPSLRFLRAAPHPSGAETPALIAGACRWPHRSPVAVQLTALSPQGQKAALSPVRWTRGVLLGAAVRLAPWGEGKSIVVVEGVEDGLAVLRSMPETTPWAVLGTANAKRVIVPAGAEVVLALDGDDPGRTAAREAGDALMAGGHCVKVAALPDGADPASLLAPVIGRAA